MALVVEMTGQEAALWQSLQRIIQQEGNLETAIARVVDASKGITREQDQLERTAQRVLNSLRGPQE